MKAEKTVVGLVFKDGRPIVCIIQDSERSNTPTFYQLEKMNLDDVVDLMNDGKKIQAEMKPMVNLKKDEEIVD